MQTLIKFRCDECDAGLKTGTQQGGKPFRCPRCEAPGTVPMTRALVPVPKAHVVPLPPRAKKRKKAGVPVRLRLPGELGGMQARVTQKTADSMATTMLGGILVAIGVALAAFFGLKPKSPEA